MYKSLDMNLASIKKHETLFPKNEPTFLFLGEVIPITNQHTDSHPASGRQAGWQAGWLLAGWLADWMAG